MRQRRYRVPRPSAVFTVHRHQRIPPRLFASLTFPDLFRTSLLQLCVLLPLYLEAGWPSVGRAGAVAR